MTPGTIGVLSMELARYASFSAAVSSVLRPEGTKVLWTLGYAASTVSDHAVIDKLNWLCENMAGDWLWILGDDHHFGETALLDLLTHDADVVCPVNISRKMPFEPLICDENGKRQDWDFLDFKDGLTSVAACGNAGMLIKRHVLEKLPKPWFEWAPEGSPYHGSDFAFCWKARQAGFKVYIDTNTVFGHTTIATFVPVRLENDQFAAMMVVQGQMVALFRFKQGQGTALFEQKGL